MPLPCPVDNARLEELVAVHGTPLQIYDEALIRSNVRGLIGAFSSKFDSFKQFFAVKALPNPAILQLLASEGCGMDCSSTSELYICKKLGITGENVMYTSNYTSKADLATAFDMGCVMNLDDMTLVDDLVEVRGRTPELISFRLNPGLGKTDSETKSNVLGGPDAKFGVPPDQIVEAYTKAQKAGSTRFGIHMMTGSCVLNSKYWLETVTVLLKTLSELRKTLGIEFEFINIGGGIGIPYRPGQPTVNVEEVSSMIKTVFDTQLAELGVPVAPRLYMENGRYVTGPFGWLVARCGVIKEAFAQKYYGLDACMANLMRPGMYEAYHYISVPAREGDDAATRGKAHVVGTLCENNDWFARDRDLPAAQKGDLFVIHDTGAHAHSMGFQYNGKLRAPELLLREDGKTAALIREREVIEDLYKNTVMPADLAPASV